MASPVQKAQNALKLERSCEASRLEEEILAAAYELATPLLRCPFPNTISGPQPAPARASLSDPPRRQTGGSKV